MTAVPPAVPTGLCASCEHRRIVRNTRGSTFVMCRRAAWDATLERYPRLPKLSCHGHRAVSGSELAGAGVAGDG